MLTLAGAHLLAGASESARAVAERITPLAREMGDARRLALAALHYGLEFVADLVVDGPRIAALREALEALGEADLVLRARLLGRLASCHAMIDAARAIPYADEAVATARRSGDPAALAPALNAQHVTRGGPEHLEERIAISEELARAAEAADLPLLVGNAHFDAIFALLEKGDTASARRHRDAFVRLARETRIPGSLWIAETTCGLFALLEGDFDAAHEIADRALALGQRLEDQSGALSFYSIQISRIWQERGSLEQLETVLKQRIAEVPHAGWRARLAYTYMERDRPEEARAEFEDLAKNDFADIQRDMIWTLTIGYLGEVAAELGDRPRAERLYELLLPHADRNVVVLTSACNGSVSRQLALLAEALGRREDADRHFADALAMNERLESPPLVARTLYDQARSLLARGSPVDLAHALQLAARALETARRLGMQRLAEKTLAVKLEAQGIGASDTRQSIHAVASEMDKSAPDLARHAAPDGTVTLVFSDIEGFTHMTERLGDLRAHEVIKEHNRIVRERTTAHGGHEVELRGDGFLLAFASARRALHCAIDLQRALTRREGELDLRIRIGLHTGEVLREADGFFGKTVIQAFRVADLAAGGEILASSLTRDLAASAGDVRFGEPREVSLKGLEGPHTVYHVAWRT